MAGIIRFYDPAVNASCDSYEGDFTLDDVLNWSDRTLEYRHDYIQHLFPLPEASPVNPDAPVITKETYEAFKSRPELRENLHRAWVRMCAFYGFESTSISEGLTLRKAANFDERAQDSWLVSRDHNHQRITRILRCLRILGLDAEAQTFFRALREADDEAGHAVSKTSWEFWSRAAEGELCRPPDPRHREVAWLRA